MSLPVLKIGDPRLRTRSQPVPIEDINSKEIQDFIDDLIETMHEENGAGIAAIQVGKPLRIFAMEVKDNPRYPYKPNTPLTVMINPEIEINTEDVFENYEGCLSVPGLRGVVNRALDITVQYYDREGKQHQKTYKGVTAGTVQHEFDHVNGTLFVDKVIDPKTLCTWDEFVKHHQADFALRIQEIVKEYGQ